MATIWVNGKQMDIELHTLTFEEIVKLSNVPASPQPTVLCTRIVGDNVALLPGQSVTVKNGSVIDVVFTGYA